MKIEPNWHTELVWAHETEPVTGVKVHQLTSAPVISNNVYGEEPCASAGGERFVFTRFSVPGLNGIGTDTSLWVCDMSDVNKRLAMIEPSLKSRPGCAKYTGEIYYQRERAGGRELVKLALETLETETVYNFEDDLLLKDVSGLVSASADGRYYIAMSVERAPQNCRLFRLDLVDKKWDVIHEKIDIVNSHLQISPLNNDILIQHNRGAVLGNSPGQTVKSYDERGITLYAIDIDGGNSRQLPVGKPYTAPVTGHQAWIGSTGEVLVTVHAVDLMSAGILRPEVASPESREGRALREGAFRAGTLFTAKPGAARPRVVTRGYLFGHISVSMDGRFYVGDLGNVPGWRPILVGSIKTGRSFIICRGGESKCFPQFSHPHPYFTADNRWVIFNSDKSGIPQIYGAELPDYLLEMLEE